MGEISENNFLGKGQRLALQANISSSNNRYNLSFTEPHLNDTDLLFGIDLYNWEREYDDYTRDSSGASLRFGYPLWNRWNAFWGYGWDDTSMTDLAVNVSQEILNSQGSTSSLKFGVSKDTRNRLYDPTKGNQHIMTVKYAGGPVGGDFDFTKLEGSTSWYFPTFWDTSFHIKGAAGYVLDNGNDTVPVYEKFYLGGINTIRGFDNGKISPINANNERVGGEKMWFANVEWIFPIIKEAGLKGLVFFDAGNVYDDSENWNLSGLKKSVGFGFRWLSPMGPLRLEWGYNIDPDPHEEQGVWDFSIGGSF
jgi:outer membrane protein insertion porin family